MQKHASAMHKYVLGTSQLLQAVLYNGYIAVSRIISLKSASLSLLLRSALLLKMAKLICIVGLLLLHPLLLTGRIGLLFKREADGK